MYPTQRTSLHACGRRSSILPGSPSLTGSHPVRHNRHKRTKCLGHSSDHVRIPHSHDKCFVFLRHGNTTWNAESRIQGNTDLSELTSEGKQQAELCRRAISHLHFDSPHTRARQTAEIVWQDRQQPLVFLDNLQEANLGWFQGRKNEDIAREHPELYRVWRDEPEAFCLDGRYLVRDAFQQARRAWQDLLSAPGEVHLIVSHKSILRSMLCTALGLPPSQFRAVDIPNGGFTIFRSKHKTGEVKLHALNWIAHVHHEGVRYSLPLESSNDTLAARVAASARPETARL